MNTKHFPDYGSDASKKKKTKRQRFCRCYIVHLETVFVILPKRIYLRHSTKRIMRASIVEIVRPMFPKLVKTTLLPLLWSAFRNCFFATFPKRIYLRHWTKRMMRGSIVEIERTMLQNTKKQRFCRCYSVPSETVFSLFCPSAFTYDT